MTTTNGKIAPHEGRELDMVLHGEKLIANVAVYNNAAQFQRVLVMAKTGMLRTDVQGDGPQMSVTFTRPANVGLIQEYRSIQKQRIDNDITDKQYHRLSGKLFGYSHEDIEAFIKSEFSCDCERCHPVKHVQTNHK